MSYCQNCGNELEPGHNFCSNCGQKPPQEKTEKIRARKPKNKRWIKISVVIAVLIIAIAAVTIGLVIGLGSNNNTSSNNNNIYTVYPTDTYQPPTQTYPTYTYQPTPTQTQRTSLSRSPFGNCQAMEQYITPNDPSVIAAMNDILNSDWRWAYNDFHTLQEWVAWHVTYVSDSVAHGQSEYWQLPSETLSLGTGDCEDFAILLCSLLRAHGVPPEDVYVGCGFTDESGHAFLFEHYYYGQWRAVEPQQSIWLELFFGDLDTSGYSTFHSFNDQDCFSGKPTPPAGVYEVEVGYSFYPLTDAASVEFQGYLNAGQVVTGSVEWYGDSGTTYSWYLDVYNPDNSSAIHWLGTDQHHDFSFTTSSAGTYRIKIWKIDYLPRVVTLEVNPPDWSQE